MAAVQSVNGARFPIASWRTTELKVGIQSDRSAIAFRARCKSNLTRAREARPPDFSKFSRALDRGPCAWFTAFWKPVTVPSTRPVTSRSWRFCSNSCCVEAISWRWLFDRLDFTVDSVDRTTRFIEIFFQWVIDAEGDPGRNPVPKSLSAIQLILCILQLDLRRLESLLGSGKLGLQPRLVTLGVLDRSIDKRQRPRDLDLVGDGGFHGGRARFVQRAKQVQQAWLAAISAGSSSPDTRDQASATAAVRLHRSTTSPRNARVLRPKASMEPRGRPARSGPPEFEPAQETRPGALRRDATSRRLRPSTGENPRTEGARVSAVPSGQHDDDDQRETRDAACTDVSHRRDRHPSTLHRAAILLPLSTINH